MNPVSFGQESRVPVRALVISAGALVVPIAATLAFPEIRAEYEALLWLAALVPAFMLAYHRGWRGVATALATGMAVLSVTQAAAATLGRGLENWPFLLAVVAVFIGVSLGIGWVSELLRRERELALQNAYDLTLLLDAEGRIESASPSVERILGFRPAELVGRPLAELLNPDHASRLPAFLEAAARGRQPLTAELTLRYALGTWRVLEASGQRAPRAAAGRGAVVLRSRDVTERKHLEDQLRKSHRMEAAAALAGGVAHDFNNVLTTIAGHTRLALDELPPRDPQRRRLESVLAAADRATSLTRQLLAFTRQQVLQPRVLDLNELLGTAEPRIRRLVGDDVLVVLDLAQRLAPVTADPAQLEQAVLSLAVRARNAMPTGGTVSLRTAEVEIDADFARHYTYHIETGPYVLLEVRDTGAAIDRAALEHIFEPFFAEARPGGTGLELSSVYGTIKQSGGYIWVDSDPGLGTVFRIYLPRAAAAAGAGTAAQEEPVDTRGSETVLVVEDDPEVRSLIRTVLLKQGYIVLEAVHGGHAIEVAERYQHTIDLLVTDIVMPEMDGRELARRLTAERPATHVLLISGYTDEANMNRDPFEPDTAFLRKPFSPDEFARAVRAVLDKAKAPAA